MSYGWFTCDGVRVRVVVKRMLTIGWKLKSRVISGLISLMESESEESECLYFFHFLHYSVAYDPVKTRLPELEAEAEEPTNHKARRWTFFRFCFRVQQFSFHQIASDGQSHKWNQSPASDSVSLIFTRSYHSMLLVTTLYLWNVWAFLPQLGFLSIESQWENIKPVL